MKSALEIFERLREGNLRFAEGLAGGGAPISPARRNELISHQDPFAVILGCSDSRVPAEIVFDQGLGDLFVIRVAGNIAEPSQIGSAEFAVELFGIPLIMVLGHSECSAVEATLEELMRPKEDRSPNLAVIVDRIRPAVAELIADEQIGEDDEVDPALINRAVRANIRAAVEHLKNNSPMLGDLVARRQLLIVGAEYSLTTGLIEVFTDGADSWE
ncbi:MAG: carbonic anhydrase [Gemmatimonadota bacterium]|jgi:carbonic anhydrase|nr:carbonic anhydrase [Gemmatimonadota bacterium]